MRKEFHHTHRTGWLRAAVLGANDGVISTASLVLGVASAHTNHAGVLVAGGAGIVAGAMAMAAGEYVSVSSQADTEHADLAIERKGLDIDYEDEHRELTEIYVERGLSVELAGEVARQLMTHDALGAHARDELGINENFRARPVQAALASAFSFMVGGAVPLLAVILAAQSVMIPAVSVASLIFLAAMGALAAWAGGAGVTKGSARVLFWGALAMAVTAGVGALVGTAL